MSNILPTDNTTRALRDMAIAQLRADGYTVERAPAAQFALQRQVYLVSKDGASRMVALRTSTSGWIGFRREVNGFPVLDGIDSVLHVRLSPTRDGFWFTLASVGFVREALSQRIKGDEARGREAGPIVWLDGDIFHGDGSGDGRFIMPRYYPLVNAPTVEGDEAEVDPIQAALGLPDWMWQAVQERAAQVDVSPEVVIRVLLGDHFAAATQSPLPVRLGA
jgi:hypothetical protein